MAPYHSFASFRMQRCTPIKWLTSRQATVLQMTCWRHPLLLLMPPTTAGVTYYCWCHLVLQFQPTTPRACDDTACREPCLLSHASRKHSIVYICLRCTGHAAQYKQGTNRLAVAEQRFDVARRKQLFGGFRMRGFHQQHKSEVLQHPKYSTLTCVVLQRASAQSTR